jgi:hypothetical protein
MLAATQDQSQWPAWIQAAAAVVQAAGAILVYIVSVRLVRLTRETILAPIEPEIRLKIPTAGIQHEDEETSIIANLGASDIVELAVRPYVIIRYIGTSQAECGETAVRLDDLKTPGELDHGKEAAIHVLTATRQGIATELHLNENQRTKFRGMKFEIRCRQAITRKRFCFVEQYQIHTWPDGKISLLPLDRTQLDAGQMIE